jgi:hypothetical protein
MVIDLFQKNKQVSKANVRSRLSPKVAFRILASTINTLIHANSACQVQNFTIDVDHGRAISHVEFYQILLPHHGNKSTAAKCL